jgi:hypothetical protein
LKEWLLDVKVWLHANNITGGTQQFSNALTLLASNVKLLVFGENIGELLDDPGMDFEYFKQRMEGSSLGTGMRTDLQRMYGINAVRTDTSKPCNTIATLGLLESMFSEMDVKLCDLGKIFYTHKAVHPGIKDRIAYQQDGSPWPAWDPFRKHLISLAAHFDATVNSRPSGNPGGYTRGGARDTRRMLRGNTQATTSAAPAAAAAGNLRSPGWHPPSRGGSVGGRGGGGGRGRGRFHPYQRPAGAQRRPAAAAATPGEIICWHCRQPGHVQATCPLKTASGSGQVSEGGVCGAVCATNSSGEEQEQQLVLLCSEVQPEQHAAAVPACTASVPAAVMPVHVNRFSALASLHDAELSADGTVLSEPSEPDELLERYYRLIADTPQHILDQAFGRGRSSYEPNFVLSKEYECLSTDHELSSVATAAAAATAVPSGADEAAASSRALDALIAQFVAQDALRPASKTSDKPLQEQEDKQKQSGSKLHRRSGMTGADAQQQSVGCWAVEDELMFNKGYFTALQGALVSPCTIDACAADDGSNALLPDYCSKNGNSYFERNFVEGDFLFLHPPRQNRELFLLRYKIAKAKCPGLGACVLLPAKYSSPVLRHMIQLTRYSRNTAIFTDVKTGQPVKAKCDFVVWIDPPKPTPEPATAVAAATSCETVDTEHENRPTTTHTMQLLGAVAGTAARVLIDSGAESHHYISAQFCKAQGIAVKQRKEALAVTGVAGAAAAAQGWCTVTLRMQGLVSQLNFVVIDMPAAFDVILGDLWLKSMKAHMDFEHGTCVVQGKGKKTITLYMDTPGDAKQQAPRRDAPAVLSYAQVKRICKQEFWHCLIVVKAVEPAAETAATVATETCDEDARVNKLKAEYPTVFTDHPPHGGSKLQIDYEVYRWSLALTQCSDRCSDILPWRWKKWKSRLRCFWSWDTFNRPCHRLVLLCFL